jgi:hypothetical protein
LQFSPALLLLPTPVSQAQSPPVPAALAPEARARAEQSRQEALRRLAASQQQRRASLEGSPAVGASPAVGFISPPCPAAPPSFVSITGPDVSLLAAQPPPTSGSTSYGVGGVGGGNGGGSGAVGSMIRQTSSERWAASHLPATPFVTKVWQSQHTAEPHVWHQHYQLCRQCVSAPAGPDPMCPHDLPHCLFCLAVHFPVVDSPFCGERCAASYAAAATQSSARRQLFDREMGVCRACGFNCHAFFKRLQALPSEQARMQALMNSPYSTDSGRLRRMLTHPKEGDFWEADHIVPVAEGGGESDLSNYQTLCTPCHAKKTKEQERRAAHTRRAAFAEGTADLRTWFSGDSTSGGPGHVRS